MEINVLYSNRISRYRDFLYIPLSRCHAAWSEWHVLLLAFVCARNNVVDVTLRTLCHLPETPVVGAHLLKSQFRQSLTNLVGNDLYGRRKAGGNLRGGHVLGLRFGTRTHEIGDDKLGGRIGSHKAAVVLVELADVAVVEPVSLASSYEGESLGIHPLVGNTRRPRILDAHDMKPR